MQAKVSKHTKVPKHKPKQKFKQKYRKYKSKYLKLRTYAQFGGVMDQFKKYESIVHPGCFNLNTIKWYIGSGSYGTLGAECQECENVFKFQLVGPKKLPGFGSNINPDTFEQMNTLTAQLSALDVTPKYYGTTKCPIDGEFYIAVSKFKRMQGDLRQYLTRNLGTPATPLQYTDQMLNIKIDEQTVKRFARRLYDLHRSGYYHGDMKPSNLMINVDKFGSISDIYLIDFDLVTKIPEDRAIIAGGANSPMLGSPASPPRQTAPAKMDESPLEQANIMAQSPKFEPDFTEEELLKQPKQVQYFAWYVINQPFVRALFDMINLTYDLVVRKPILFDLYILIILCYVRGYNDIMVQVADVYKIHGELREMNMLH